MTFEISNLGVSSIAWEPDEDRQVSEALATFGISNIDLAPSKYFPWSSGSAITLASEKREFWESRNFKIRGVQSLLFGAPNWNILSKSDWPALFRHFENVFNITETLGAKFLVFGSPGNRKLNGLQKDKALDVAEEFFRKLAAMMTGRELELTIEANPTRYGCDFITSTIESAELVARVESVNISSQLDLGTCLINSEKLEDLKEQRENFGYVHLSTFDLKPLHLEKNDLILEYLQNPIAGDHLTIEQKSPMGQAVESLTKTVSWLRENTDSRKNFT